MPAPLLRPARLLAGIVALLLTAAAAQAQAEEKPPQESPAQEARAPERSLRIATEGAYPPFNTVGPDNQPAGFEVELGQALCAAAQLGCTWVIQDWDGLIDGLLERRHDAVMASLAITERRRARIAFTKPYYRIPAAFMALKESDLADAGPAALEGRIVGTVEGSEHQAYLEAVHPRAEVRTYAKLEEANLDLIAERIDLVLGDRLALGRFLATRGGGCCRIVGEAPWDKRFYGEGVGIGLRPDDIALRDAFNRAIDQVIADGTYDRIRAKYLAFSTR